MGNESKEIVKILQEIHQTIKNIEKQMTINSQSNQSKKEDTYHLDIEHVNIDQFDLDDLTYHIDKIDIKELSGMMNVGNTFSPSLSKQKKQKQQSSSSTSKEDDTRITSSQDKKTKPVIIPLQSNWDKTPHQTISKNKAIRVKINGKLLPSKQQNNKRK
ncbi:hypothetical protein NC797_13790 [Aquibacillus sp. 3ASR75-11]|uniref:Uncharacterized protein n=1 Tax=Terrihalobacillus insolitus TaxID=2950438 RepID=A0A9X4AN87_9BACI|nr:hypothetical protein [Terrihalobacillus insolitus]MDC3413715.1 hypothetical protein [Terrihalobacillus insolitus]MDC3425574.1 hypothetical protein [Terrihalobacillus insolitus]